ncbi:MAG: hypothetical protein M5U22_19365 [Thermoleophilia bacterium]|nr:hypothetical protein [Thermoleophilia bacterium]
MVAQSNGCLAVKFEAAFLRRLDFDKVSVADDSNIYARYVNGGEPSHAEYKALQDFLFRYNAREAGRLGMAVHIHTFHGPGGFYRAADSDPLLLESTFNDPSLRGTKFVLIHGGGVYAASFGPGVGWELGAWIAATTARQALAIALKDMMRSGEITLVGAEEIATMVMRTNAGALYNLPLERPAAAQAGVRAAA